MARPEWRDRVKERFWRQVVRRWRRSGLGVRAYCAGESLSEANFYAWRRELAQRDQEAAADAAGFVPIHVRPDVIPTASVPDITPAAPAAIDVLLTNGRALRVSTGFDATMLRQLLAVAEEPPAC
jgi:hypothetical protein